MATRTHPHLRVSQAGVLWVEVPVSSDAPGQPGQVAFDEAYFYLCVAEDSWRRIPLEGW